MRRSKLSALKSLLLCLAMTLTSSSFAQLATGTDPVRVADQAVRTWLEQEPLDIGAVGGLSTSELCVQLPDMLLNPPPPEGTSVNFEGRREASSEEAQRIYSYPASLPGERLEVVDVVLERQNGGWSATRVGFHADPAPTGIRAWLQEPLAAGLFVLFSAAVLWLLLRPSSVLRRWLAQGRSTIRQFRGVVIGTQIALYSLFFLGALLGSQLPPSCTDAILEVVNTAVTTVGATDAYGSGNIPRAAVVTFYQNFVMVTLLLLFGLALLFGLPAYLFGGLSFFAQGIPFGLLGTLGLGQMLMVGLLLVLELTSYFLVIAGGGILLATVIREGIGAFGLGVRRLAQMLPFALLFLLLGAWYEALIIILPQLLGP